MAKWFHCTRSANARKILRGGFWTGRINAEYADYYGGYLSNMLTKAERDENNDAWEEGGDEAAARHLARTWNRKFSEGTLIWLSKQPDVEFGETCFEVTLPRNARLLGGNRDMGWIFYAPHPIAPKHFKEIEVGELRRQQGLS
jgi:hypothetical protein